MPIAPPGFPNVGVGTAAAGQATNIVQQQLPFPYIPVQAPLNYQSGQFNSPTRGIASLSFEGRTWRFRTNPNSVMWSYVLNTNVQQTYGGRVVQILSTKIGDMIVKVECGNGDTGGVNGGWKYNYDLVLFLRDLLVAQRDPMAKPANFQYTTRRWNFNVYGLSIPFEDKVDATVRELELHFKVQEDVSGVVSGAILDAALNKMKDGIGWTRNKYNSASAYAGTPGSNIPGQQQGGAGNAGNNQDTTPQGQQAFYGDPNSGPNFPSNFAQVGPEGLAGMISGAGLSSIPGLGSVLGGLGGLGGIIGI